MKTGVRENKIGKKKKEKVNQEILAHFLFPFPLDL